MIIEYNRPTSVDEALALLTRNDVHSIPIGGGSSFRRLLIIPCAVVDLQELDFDEIFERGKFLEVGATVTLQSLQNSQSISAVLNEIIRFEAGYNLRQVSTIAGTLVAANGRSLLATALLSLDAHLVLMPGDEVVSLGDFLPIRSKWLQGRLIVAVRFPINVKLEYEFVARTPADQPIVCAAIGKWPSGRTRVALGGFGEAPVLVFDGPQSSGAVAAAKNAYSLAADVWASSAYRQEIASILTGRILSRLEIEQ